MQETITRSKGEILSYIKSLTSAEQSGEVLVHGETERGKVYLRDGRIAWAFASGQQESFQSILITENRVSKDELIDGIQKSREAGKKELDEILVTLGIADAADRLLIIQRHTKAALEAISSWEQCTIELSDDSTQQSEAPANVSTEEFKTVEELLERLKAEIPGFIAAVIVDGETGTPISSLRSTAEGEESFDLDTISAYYLNVIRSAGDALEALGKSNSDFNPIEEIIITGKEEYVVLRVLHGGKQMFYLLQDHAGNPGVGMMVIRRYLAALSGLFDDAPL